MGIRNYVGARYVPKFADPVEWQANTYYEAMVIVTYNNSSYTSKVPVPPTVGNPAENSKYWALTGNYNAQLQYVSNSLASHVGNTSNPHNVTAEQLGVAKTNIVDMIYPVGSIYMSVNNVSPSTLFGGTWVQIQDRFLLASGSNYTNGNTGGSDTHTLNTNELPAHTHIIPEHRHNIDELKLYRIQIYKEDTVTNESPGLYINSQGSYVVDRGMVPTRGGTALSSGNEWVHTVASTTEFMPSTYSGSAGDGQAFSTMPPYLVVNIWKRTA